MRFRCSEKISIPAIERQFAFLFLSHLTNYALSEINLEKTYGSLTRSFTPSLPSDLISVRIASSWEINGRLSGFFCVNYTSRGSRARETSANRSWIMKMETLRVIYLGAENGVAVVYVTTRCRLQCFLKVRFVRNAPNFSPLLVEIFSNRRPGIARNL